MGMVPASQTGVPMNREHKDGTFFAIAAYQIWGLFPIYWKQLTAVPALQLIGHRIVWSFVLLGLVLIISGRVGAFLGSLDRNAARAYVMAALLISVNWFVYVWAVTQGLIVEASLPHCRSCVLALRHLKGRWDGNDDAIVWLAVVAGCPSNKKLQ